jgi:hypothetical protein
MFTKLKQKIKNDKGNAVVVLGLMLIVVSLAVGGMMLDISKAYQFKSSYVEAAKKSTQSAIRMQNTEGFLTYKSIAETIRVYELVARPSVMKPTASLSKCGNSRYMEVYLGYADGNGKAFKAGRFNMNDSRMESLRLGQLKNPNLYNVQSTMSTIESIYRLSSLRNQIEAGEFTSITLEMYEATPNFILPAVFSMYANDEEREGIMCQRLGVTATASQFVGDEDGEFK